MPLQVSILSSPTGYLILDPTPYLSGLTFSTNEHGFAACSFFVSGSLQDSFFIYDRPGFPHVAVTEKGATAWEGRLEDVAIVDGGIRFSALGYRRALSDTPYTAGWSISDVKAWRNVTETEISAAAPAKYEFNQDNQLYTSLRKNEIYATSDESGDWVLQLPYSGSRAAYYVSFSYDYTLPTNWTHRVQTWDEGFSGSSLEDTITGDGANHTGTKTITIAGANKEYVIFRTFNVTGADYTNTLESDEWYIKLTNVRVTTAALDIDPADIVKDIISKANAANSSQLNSGTKFVEDTGLDLFNEVYEDADMGQIVDYLAALGDDAGNVYESPVWENQVLYYRPRGSDVRNLYFDASSLNVERTINVLRNAAYGVYRDAGGRNIRTSTSTDSFSVARYGVTRTAPVTANTTDSTQAGLVRDTFLADHKSPIPRAGVEVKEIFDASGTRLPLWVARAGHVATARNLSPTLSADIDRIRTFRIAETEYNADADTLSITPESPLPTLDFLLARKAEGVE